MKFRKRNIGTTGWYINILTNGYDIINEYHDGCTIIRNGNDEQNFDSSYNNIPIDYLVPKDYSKENFSDGYDFTRYDCSF